MNDIETKMELILEEEIPERILAPIRAARSFFGHANSATYLKLLSDETTLANLSKKKLELQLSLAHFNPPSLSSNTFQGNGNEIAKKNDCWELVLRE